VKKCNQSGVAMLMALVTLTVLGILIAQLVYETEVYHRIVYNTVDELRAKNLAKSALKIGLLQVHAANKAKKKAKNMGGAVSSELLDKIWQTPVILPAPTLPGMAEADKKSVEAFNQSLGFNGRMSVNTYGESNKLNLNSLVWLGSAEEKSDSTSGSTGSTSGSTTAPNPKQLSPEELKKTLEESRKFITETIAQIIENKKREDDNFEERYSNLKAETLVQNLLAWIDPETTTDGEGRPKDEYYQRLQPKSFGVKNGPLQSITELHMVKGFDDQIVKLLEGSFTALTTAGININKISATLLQSLLPELSPVDIEKLLERRTDESLGGPFKNADDFWQAANRYGNIQEAKDRFAKNRLTITTEETAYRVVVESNSGNASKTWVAQIGPPPPLPPTNSNNPYANDPNAINTNGLDITADPASVNRNNTTNNNGKNDNKLPAIIYLKAE
jgi:type II secretory pathway component PulK